MIWEIYELRNSVNGKVYVGLTRHGARKRWRQHQTSAKTGSKESALYSAIRKYGVSAFELTVIATVSSLEAAKDTERNEIARRNSICPNGYNLTTGGETFEGFNWSAEAKRRQSIAAKNRPPKSAETRRRIGEAGRNRPPPSAETRAKLRTARLGAKMTEQTRAKMRAISVGRRPPNTPEIQNKKSLNTLRKMLESALNGTAPMAGFYKKGNRWQARLTVCGVKKHLGCFACIEDARAAYLAALIAAVATHPALANRASGEPASEAISA